MKLLYLLAPILVFADSVCLFTPPKGWQAAQPKNLSEHVQIGFIGKGSTAFCPSINLATETINCSLKEYVKAVKRIHLSEPKTQWKNLGKIEMKAGQGVLTEIISPSSFGDVHILQAIYARESTAYILTAAVLKPDFIQLQKDLLVSLASLSLEENLAAAMLKPDLKGQFQELFSTLGSYTSADPLETQQSKQWSRLQEFVAQNGEEMGGYWQFLALKEGFEKIYQKNLKESL